MPGYFLCHPPCLLSQLAFKSAPQPSATSKNTCLFRCKASPSAHDSHQPLGSVHPSFALLLGFQFIALPCRSSLSLPTALRSLRPATVERELGPLPGQPTYNSFVFQEPLASVRGMWSLACSPPAPRRCRSGIFRGTGGWNASVPAELTSPLRRKPCQVENRNDDSEGTSSRFLRGLLLTWTFISLFPLTPCPH